MALVGTFILLTMLGEFGTLLYLAYAIPAFVRAHPLGRRRTASFLAATLAIAPTVMFLVMLLLGFGNLFASHFGAPISQALHILLFSLIVVWGTSLACSLVHQEFFEDEELRSAPIRAALIATGVVAIVCVPTAFLGDAFALLAIVFAGIAFLLA
jgi:hypothetical protein